MVVIWMDAVPGIEGSGGLERIASDQCGLVVGREAVEEITCAQPPAGSPRRERARDDAGAVPEVCPVGEDGAGTRGRVEVRPEPREAIGQGDVVGVVERDPVATGDTKAEVTGGSEAAVLTGNHLDPVTVRGEDLLRVVGRAVVDHHDLSRRGGLRQDAVQALGEPATGVVGRDDDRDHPQWLAAMRASTEGSTRPKSSFGRRKRLRRSGMTASWLPYSCRAAFFGAGSAGERGKATQCVSRILAGGGRLGVSSGLGGQAGSWTM